MSSRAEGPRGADRRQPEIHLDPRLDTSAWRVFGRRLPRRWSLYFRIAAALLLVLSLGWWFTRDVTYVGNVKVSGLRAAAPAHREPFRAIADDFAALVNRLADDGYGWQAGGLPAMRIAGALTDAEASRYLAVGSVEVAKRGTTLQAGGEAASLSRFLSERGWITPSAEKYTLAGTYTDRGPLRATLDVSARPEQHQRLVVLVSKRPAS